MKPILYLITYDAAIERKEPYATEICAVFTTCDKQKADAALERMRTAGKTTASITELPFEENCDEIIAAYYE